MAESSPCTTCSTRSTDRSAYSRKRSYPRTISVPRVCADRSGGHNTGPVTARGGARRATRWRAGRNASSRSSRKDASCAGWIRCNTKSSGRSSRIPRCARRIGLHWSILETLPASHPEVHDLLGPAPERILPFHRDALYLVAVPAVHDLRVLRPDLHAVAGNQLLPVLRDRRVGVQQPHGDVARQVLDRTE